MSGWYRCKFESPVKNMFLIICKCTFGNVNFLMSFSLPLVSAMDILVFSESVPKILLSIVPTSVVLLLLGIFSIACV